MFQDLDPKIAGALTALRQEFEDKLTSLAQRLQEEIPEQAPEAPVAAPAAPAFDALSELKLAAIEVDRAGSQADLLDALLKGAARFSSRSAVFLLRQASLEGWAAAGFGEQDSALKGLRLEPEPDSPWGQLGSAGGAFPLSAADCAVLCDELGARGSDVGVLLPLYLGEDAAAALYCDRVRPEDPFEISALQLLAFLAGQTLETMPVRGRDSTATLQLATLASTPEAQPAVPEPEPAPFEPPAPEPAAFEAPTPEPAAFEPPEPEPAAVEPPEPEPAAVEPPEPEPAAFEPPAPEPAAFEPVEPEPPVVEAVAPEPTMVEPVEAEAPMVEPPAAEPVMETTELHLPDFSAPPVEPEPPQPAPPSPDISMPEEAADAASLGSTQVVPPQDVEGPGWAFTTTKIPTSAGTEALHEEARRLARLLVTEIKLYNEEQVEEGRRIGDVYSRLREDIDRSRQIFDDRIDAAVRDEKDYFREALIRILAGGDPSILGM
jgi:hypothetical protein